jgi:glutamyl-Q tRNA(Asp) synthetase
LSKQTGAQALDLNHPLDELLRAASFLQLHVGQPNSLTEFWRRAIIEWQQRFDATPTLR